MNERIKELAKQAGVHFGIGTTDYFGEYFPPWISTRDMDLEKFAELIVRECMLIIEDAVDHREPASTYVAKLADHFGVTE